MTTGPTLPALPAHSVRDAWSGHADVTHPYKPFGAHAHVG